eukprot:1157843-Pelagomonas_calceolata.AAC.4
MRHTQWPVVANLRRSQQARDYLVKKWPCSALPPPWAMGIYDLRGSTHRAGQPFLIWVGSLEPEPVPALHRESPDILT